MLCPPSYGRFVPAADTSGHALARPEQVPHSTIDCAVKCLDCVRYRWPGSNHLAAPARRKEECDAACNVRTDLWAQRFEPLLEQRPQHDGQDDQVEEGSCRCREALRGEGR